MSVDKPETVEEMFVQLATGMVTTPSSLRLEGVTSSTLYFSDRSAGPASVCSVGLWRTPTRTPS